MAKLDGMQVFVSLKRETRLLVLPNAMKSFSREVTTCLIVHAHCAVIGAAHASENRLVAGIYRRDRVSKLLRGLANSENKFGWCLPTIGGVIHL